MADSIGALPRDVRERLEAFARAVERIPLDELPLYAVRPREPAHAGALERSTSADTERDLMGAVDEARSALAAYVDRQYVAAQYRMSGATLNWGGLGTIDDRIRIAETLGDAATALVLWDAIDEADRAELMGPWANLIE